MQEANASLGPEWQALELLCTECSDDRSEQLAAALAAEPLHWGELLEHALLHQLLPLLALRVLELQASGDVQVPGRIAHHLAEVLEGNRWQLQVMRREAVRVATALGERGLPLVATKGITFESTIYRGLGVRKLKDIDFMIRPEDRDATAGVLARLGYRVGMFDRASGRIGPLPRRMHMIYMLNPDHLPRHVRLCDEAATPYLYVDFANSLTWHGSRYEVPVAEALASRRQLELPGDVGAVPCFAPDFQFLFTVLHLFREAWHEQWLDYELDVSLMKFADVIRLFDAHREDLVAVDFADLLQRYDLVKPVAWVLVHTDQTFGTDMAERTGLADRVDADWLAAAYPSHGVERRWRGSMRERLWARDRRALFQRLGTEERD